MTFIVATLNEQVKLDSADPSLLGKKLPAAEKQTRLEKQQDRLKGVKNGWKACTKGVKMESLRLVINCWTANSIVEPGAIVWMAPSRCSKRDDEIHANIKPSSTAG